MKKYICNTINSFWNTGEEVDVVSVIIHGTRHFECYSKSRPPFLLTAKEVNKFLTPLPYSQLPGPPPHVLNAYPNTAECINKFFDIPVGAIVNYRRTIDGSWVEYFYQGLESSTGEDTFFNHFKSLDTSVTPNIPKQCQHTWKTYVGLIDKFDYCEKCDEKRK